MPTNTMPRRLGRRTRILGAAAALTVAAAPLAAAQSAAGATPAASASPRDITFDDAVQIALRQNTAIQQARNGQAASAADVQQSKLAFLPDLRLNANSAQSYGRTFSQGDGQILNTTTNSLNGGVSSSVTLFNGGANVAQLRGATLGESAAAQDLARTQQTVVFDVASGYLNLITAQEQLGVQRANLAALQQQEDQIQKMVAAGTRPVSDLYQQQASVAAAQAAVVSAQRTLALSKVDVIQTLQLDPRGDYDFVPPAVQAPDSASLPRYDLDSLLTRAYARRADLQAQDARVGAARQDVKAAAASRWPSISLSAGYNSGYSSAGDAALIDQLDQRRGGSVSVGVSIPLFDRGQTSVATERAQLGVDNQRLALQNLRQQVALEVRRAYLDYQAAQQQLAAATAQQKAAQLALTTTEQRYRVGAATLLVVTQARASEVQAQSAVVNARYGLVFQQALMRYYVGDLDPAHVALG